MTNELQIMVDNMSQSPHVDSGTSELLIAVIGIAIFAVVMYISGAISEYRKTKKFLKPNSWYFKNIAKGCSNAIKAIAGVAVPAAQVVRGDAYYYQPTQDEFDEALLVTHQLMIDGGWTLANYARRAKDCEDYAMKMAVEIRNYIATTFPDKVGAKGVAVGNIGYTRDVDGAGHAIVMVHIDDRVKYYEPYPGEEFLKEKSMSQKELASISMSIM